MPVPKGTRIGGRQKGTPNKVQSDIRAIAQQHGPAAIDRLVWLVTHADNHATQVSAAAQLLDRGYGKPAQAQDVKLSGTMHVTVATGVPS